MTNFGPFRIGPELGRGAEGVVYRAIQMPLERPVALKILPAELEAQALQHLRFQRELHVSGKLAHPGIVRVFDAGTIDRQHYIAMELVEGSALQVLLDRGGVGSWPTACAMILRIAEALAYLHGEGILHRDLKPSNVMVTQAGEIKLSDFGLALPLDATGITASNQLVGTILYMAPELITGSTATAQSDLWSVGCIAYELISGRPLFDCDHKSLPQIVDMILNGFLQPLEGVAPGIPGELSRQVMALLERSPARRTATAAALVEGLRTVLPVGSPTATIVVEPGAATPGAPPRAGTPKPSGPLLVTVPMGTPRSRPGAGRSVGQARASGALARRTLEHRPPSGETVVGHGSPVRPRLFPGWTPRIHRLVTVVAGLVLLAGGLLAMRSRRDHPTDPGGPDGECGPQSPAERRLDEMLGCGTSMWAVYMAPLSILCTDVIAENVCAARLACVTESGQVERFCREQGPGMSALARARLATFRVELMAIRSILAGPAPSAAGFDRGRDPRPPLASDATAVSLAYDSWARALEGWLTEPVAPAPDWVELALLAGSANVVAPASLEGEIERLRARLSRHAGRVDARLYGCAMRSVNTFNLWACLAPADGPDDFGQALKDACAPGKSGPDGAAIERAVRSSQLRLLDSERRFAATAANSGKNRYGLLVPMSVGAKHPVWIHGFRPPLQKLSVELGHVTRFTRMLEQVKIAARHLAGDTSPPELVWRQLDIEALYLDGQARTLALERCSEILTALSKQDVLTALSYARPQLATSGRKLEAERLLALYANSCEAPARGDDARHADMALAMTFHRLSDTLNREVIDETGGGLPFADFSAADRAMTAALKRDRATRKRSGADLLRVAWEIGAGRGGMLEGEALASALDACHQAGWGALAPSELDPLAFETAELLVDWLADAIYGPLDKRSDREEIAAASHSPPPIELHDYCARVRSFLAARTSSSARFPLSRVLDLRIRMIEHLLAGNADVAATGLPLETLAIDVVDQMAQCQCADRGVVGLILDLYLVARHGDRTATTGGDRASWERVLRLGDSIAQHASKSGADVGRVITAAWRLGLDRSALPVSGKTLERKISDSAPGNAVGYLVAKSLRAGERNPLRR